MIALPDQILDAQAAHPIDDLRHAAQSLTAERCPPLASSIETLKMEVFGLQAGFFYLPIAVAREWSAGDEWCERLGVALAVGHAHFALQDTLVDVGSLPPLLALQSDVFLLTYLDLISDLSANGADVRALHDHFYSDYCAALAAEFERRRCVVPFEAADVRGLGNKAAPGNVVLHLVAGRTEHGDAAESLVRSVMLLCTAFQLQDDLGDLEEDLESGIMTFPSTLAAVQSLGLPTGGVQLDRSTRARIVEAVFLGGAAEAALRLAQRYLDEALSSAQDAKAHALIELIEVCRRRNEEELNRLGAEQLAIGIRSGRPT
jgi:hypothetical protein